uniref:Uncharacterized protein n=1 Tax=Avena sativa TaxID=4498 RepID=A0ACD5YER6_AVESA
MLKLKRIANISNDRRKSHKQRRVKEGSGISSGGRREAASPAAQNLSQELCWNELSQQHAAKLSPSVLSLASYDGDKMHCKSTGVVVRNNSAGACVLTSSALVRTLDAGRWLMPALKIKLRLPNKKVVDGWIEHYDLPFSMVVIGTMFSPDLRVACLSDSLHVELHTELHAVKCCFDSGKLMETRGQPIGGQSQVDSEGFMLSTCKITMDGSGGPLVDFDGNIVGMNDYHGLKMTRYVQTDKILECLGDLWCSDEEMEKFAIDFDSFSEEFTKDKLTTEFTKVEPTPPLIEDEHKNLNILDPWPFDDFTKEVNDILKSDGYPLPAYADDKERHFACTGISIECNESTSTVLTSASLVRTSGHENKIIDNLRIEVCLPTKQRVGGTLLHYDLSYNVAVVTIPIVCRSHAAISVESTQTKVVALRRAFKSGNLMATDGLMIGEQDKFDCRELKFSTSKITKAGIGGPLYDLSGNFVGMNFYDTEGTPYLPRNIILKLLKSFDAERY